MPPHWTSLLPVFNFIPQILATVENNWVTVISASTGAGKSLLVTLHAYLAGKRVRVTQPRRLPTWTIAKTLCDALNELTGENYNFGVDVGYKTGFESNATETTPCLFITDGMEVKRLLFETIEFHSEEVLIIDELHELNLNQEMILVMLKLIRKHFPNLRVILMSATMNTHKISNYFGEDVPVINIEGRLHDIKKEVCPPEEKVAKAVEMVKEGRNILVFEPGKQDIYERMGEIRRALEKSKIEAVVLPLHAKLTQDAQKLCLASYNVPKVVVCTNAVEMSVTIPDITGVITSGWTRVDFFQNGVHYLKIIAAARSNILQQMGRCGRCGPGRFVFATKMLLENRRKYPVPAIKRQNLSGLILSFLARNIDPWKVDFLNRPPKDAMLDGFEELYSLGAVDESHKITELGMLMALVPTGPRAAKAVVNSEGLASEIAVIASVIENGSLKYYSSRDWRGEVVSRNSDWLVEYELYLRGLEVWYEFEQKYEQILLSTIDNENEAMFEAIELKQIEERSRAFRRIGIDPRNFERVHEYVSKKLGKLIGVPEQYSLNEKERLVSITLRSFSDKVYVLNPETNTYRHVHGIDPHERVFASESILSFVDEDKLPQLVIGLPVSIGDENNNFNHILTHATAITPEWLVTHIEDCEIIAAGIDAHYNANLKSVCTTTRLNIQGSEVDILYKNHEHPESVRLFIEYASENGMGIFR